MKRVIAAILSLSLFCPSNVPAASFAPLSTSGSQIHTLQALSERLLTSTGLDRALFKVGQVHVTLKSKLRKTSASPRVSGPSPWSQMATTVAPFLLSTNFHGGTTLIVFAIVGLVIAVGFWLLLSPRFKTADLAGLSILAIGRLLEGTDRLYTRLHDERVMEQLEEASIGEWHPEKNKAAQVVTEMNPQDYFRVKEGQMTREEARKSNRSGWVNMANDTLQTAQATLDDDVKRMEDGIRMAHNMGADENPIEYVIWAGMGGSAEIGKVINERLGPEQKKRHIFILDTTDSAAVKALFANILRLEEQRLQNDPSLIGLRNEERYHKLMQIAVRKMLVIGVSMGMTSEEPVINMTAIYEQCFKPNMDAGQIGVHFWAMTLPNSTVHQFIQARKWEDEQRLPIQLNEQSTLSGRNSYDSRVALLHLALQGQSVYDYLAAQAKPRFDNESREKGMYLGAALAVAEEEGLTQPTFLMPKSLQPAAYWLMQQNEESLGKNEKHLMKIDAPTEVPWDLMHPLGDPKQKRVFIHVTVDGEDDEFAKDIKQLRRKGYSIIELHLPKVPGVLGSSPMVLHLWVHATFTIGYVWGNDTVGQYFVELYKKYVQEFMLDGMWAANGAFGHRRYDFSEVNTESVTLKKQEWMLRENPAIGSLAQTEAWNRFESSPHLVRDTESGLALHYDGLIGENSRYSRQQIDSVLTDMNAPPLDAGATIAQIMAAWLLIAKREANESKKSFAEMTYFGDMVYSDLGKRMSDALNRMALQLFGKEVGILTHVVEGPRDNHSRLECSTGARNEGLIFLVTGSFNHIRNKYPTSTLESSTLEGYLDRLFTNTAGHAGYPADYLPMQALATWQSYLDNGRQVVMLEGNISPEKIDKLRRQVHRQLYCYMDNVTYARHISRYPRSAWLSRQIVQFGMSTLLSKMMNWVKKWVSPVHSTKVASYLAAA